MAHGAFLAASTLTSRDGKRRAILIGDELPAQPAADRVFMLPNEPDSESETGLHIPDIAQHKPNSGRLLAAGLVALDRLYDHGIEIGDEVWWGRFAGVIEEWDHIVSVDKKLCQEHTWDRDKAPKRAQAAFRCSNCRAIRHVDPLIVANVDDVLVSMDLAARLRAGDMEIVRTKGPDGRTQHVYRRKGE